MKPLQRASVSSVAALVLAATAVAGSATGAPRPARDDAATVQRLTLRAGLQLGAKHVHRPTVRVGTRRYGAPDPLLAELPAGVHPDLSYWRHRRASQATRRVAARSTRAGRLQRAAVPTPVAYAEHEPPTSVGENDTWSTAEQIADVGVGQPYQAVVATGRLAVKAITVRRGGTKEDQGSIPRATPTRIGPHRERLTLSSRIGDGPHGRARDRHGDFDFFGVHATAGQRIDADTIGSRIDTVLVVYTRAGRIVASNDDADDGTTTSALSYSPTVTGDYFVMVAGFSPRGSVPANPFRTASGTGAGAEGFYKLRITERLVDRDFYAVHLDSGQLLGGVLTGGAHTVRVTKPDGTRMVASQQDASGSYPAQSPLPGGGATFAYVAEEPGWYAVSAEDGQSAYRLLLETYKPGTATTRTQTIFLDFDGARINTNIFQGPGVSTLSPLRSFLGRWGLSASDESAVISATVATVKHDLSETLVARGLNKSVKVEVLNSRDDPDLFGDPDVSRVVVGGTINQSGIPTIGISQSVDPGNYAHEESALVLLDEVSAPPGADDSLNTYLGVGSDRVAFVGRALGTLVAHETGHLIGSFHTDNANAKVNLMDAGGQSFGSFFGVGPDGVGGTADDTDVTFDEDAYSPDEGFAGRENTLNVSAWAFLLNVPPAA
ncbi:MAG: PPC domain-containing protein [Nocardioidaceae bacterium]